MNNEITSVLVESKIFLIRGKQVMIDRDLAELYGVETKRITEAVKRNIERFPEDFMFQLTKVELDLIRTSLLSNNIVCGKGEDWKSQIVTSNSIVIKRPRRSIVFVQDED